jgi:hypothetical protein
MPLWQVDAEDEIDPEAIQAPPEGGEESPEPNQAPPEGGEENPEANQAQLGGGEEDGEELSGGEDYDSEY